MNFAEYMDRLERGFRALSNQLPLILDDPRAYPRETMVLALIAAIALLIVAVSVLLVVEWSRDRATRRRLGVRRKPRSVAVAAGIAGAVIASILLLMAWAPLIPAVGHACGTCHAIDAAVDSWSADAHSGVSCYGCHATPGPLGAIESGFRGVGVALAGSSAPPADSRGCIKCHDDITEGVTESQGMRVRHSDMIDAGMPCTQCHPDIGHDAGSATQAKAAGEISRPRMSICLGCHDDETVSAECDVCHSGSNPSDRVSQAAPSGRTVAPVTCTGCHRAETDANCVNCHGLVMPHPGTFIREHAGASWKDPALCASCHEAAEAGAGCACHTDVNDHGTFTEWFPRHMTAARANGPGGCNCHQLPSCARCHDSNPWE